MAIQFRLKDEEPVQLALREVKPVKFSEGMAGVAMAGFCFSHSLAVTYLHPWLVKLEF